MDCAFCQNQDVKDRSVYDDGLVFAFPSVQPIVPGHLLIAPKRHAETFDELDLMELQSLISARARLMPALKTVVGAEGFHFAWNQGAVAGQTVPHFHLHLVPRKAGDAGITDYEPRKFLYRPGPQPDSPQAELLAVSEAIRKAIV